jgi:toxin ParE1/3/4
MKEVSRLGAARQDLVQAYRYYAREAGIRVAERFIAQSEATFARLASMPGLGTPYECDHPALALLRFLPIAGFRKYLIFYRQVDDGIEIVRVLHGARDFQRILADDFGIDEGSGNGGEG